MNAELLGIITVVIVLLGVGAVIGIQSNEIQLIPQTGEKPDFGPYTSSTKTDFQSYCEIIPAACG